MSYEPLTTRMGKAMTGWVKDIVPWRGGLASSENGDNFVTNQMTAVNFSDTLAAKSRSAIGLSAAWACVNLLAGTISSLPLMVYRTDRSGVRTVARGHALYGVLHDSPNLYQSAVDFWEYQTAAIELQGNAFAEVERRLNGDIIALRPLPPERVKAERQPDGRIVYVWTQDGRRREMPASAILHIRGPLGDMLSGRSTLSACRGAFETALSVDGAAASMFMNGVRPSGVLMADRQLSTEQRRVAEQLLQEKFMGAVNAGRPMLLDNNLKWQAMSLSADDAEMLASRRFSVEEVCRIFGVPPHMIGHTENSTSWGTGLEQQTLGFVKFSLRRRLKRIEQALEKQLLSARDRAEGITIEFNLEGLLRGDSAGRASFYQSGLNNGWMTINEVRRLENMPPVAGGDVPRMQSQNVPITNAGQEGSDDEQE